MNLSQWVGDDDEEHVPPWSMEVFRAFCDDGSYVNRALAHDVAGSITWHLFRKYGVPCDKSSRAYELCLQLSAQTIKTLDFTTWEAVDAALTLQRDLVENLGAGFMASVMEKVLGLQVDDQMQELPELE